MIGTHISFVMGSKIEKGKAAAYEFMGQARSKQDYQVGFDSSSDEKLSALFNKLSQVERKVDCVIPLARRVWSVKNVDKS